MRIYYADIRGLDESRALYPGTSKSRGSAFGVSLLATAYADCAGRAMLPKIERQLLGRPVFSSEPELNFSVSHSETHVVCALSHSPVGIDTEPADRAVSRRVIEKLTTAEEREFLSFLEIWTLRESLFKLTGEGNLRTMRFYRRLGKIVAPVEGAKCRIYKDVEGAVISVSTFDGSFPNKLIEIPAKQLLKKDKPLQSYPKGFRLD